MNVTILDLVFFFSQVPESNFIPGVFYWFHDGKHLNLCLVFVLPALVSFSAFVTR
jgi:hypothetical protein